jgi:hypothetical protein
MLLRTRSGYPHLEELYLFGEGVLTISAERGFAPQSRSSASVEVTPFRLAHAEWAQKGISKETIWVMDA